MDFIENEYIYDDIEGLQEMLMEVSTEYYILHVKKFSIIYMVAVSQSRWR